MFHQMISATDGGLLTLLCLAVTVLGIVSLPWRDRELESAVGAFGVVGSALFSWLGGVEQPALVGGPVGWHRGVAGRHIRFHRGASALRVHCRRAA